MRPDISEFSYGFAMTYELIQSPAYSVTAVPVFPSLVQEGGTGGGWDVRLDRPTIPLFLQFKLADYMMKSTCKEASEGFPLPCYRMHIRSTRLSQQHQLLLQLESRGQEVYYSAPAFHRPRELNDAFLTGQMRARSLWLRPSDIGPLPDQEDHHVSFCIEGPWTVFSSPRPVKGRTFQHVAAELSARLEERGEYVRSSQYWQQLSNEMERIIGRRAALSAPATSMDAQLRRRHPAEQVAFYASVFLGSQLFLVRRGGA